MLGEGQGGAVTRSGAVKLHAVFPTKTIIKERLFILNAFLTTYANECLNLSLEEIMTTFLFYH